MPYATAEDGTRIFYELAGRPSGEPILMLQGLGADSRGWIFQRRALGRHYRLVLVDNRGVGKSEVPHTNYDLEVMATDALACLDDAGIESAHVMGASMGGIIAQVLAARHASRVRSLILCCTSCRHHEWRRELLADWEDIARSQGMRALLGRAMRWLIGPRTRRRFALPVGLLGHLILATPADTFVGQIRAILSMDDALRTELAGVKVPALIVVGTQDILTPAGDSEELAELLEHSELFLITGAAHGFMVEQARELNELTLAFLDRITGRTSGAPHVKMDVETDGDVSREPPMASAG